MLAFSPSIGFQLAQKEVITSDFVFIEDRKLRLSDNASFTNHYPLVVFKIGVPDTIMFFSQNKSM